MTINLKKITILTVIGLTLMSFTAAITAQTDFTILASKSNVKWTGYKPGGQHKGTVDVKSGSFCYGRRCHSVRFCGHRHDQFKGYRF